MKRERVRNTTKLEISFSDVIAVMFSDWRNQTRASTASAGTRVNMISQSNPSSLVTGNYFVGSHFFSFLLITAYIIFIFAVCDVHGLGLPAIFTKQKQETCWVLEEAKSCLM